MFPNVEIHLSNAEKMNLFWCILVIKPIIKLYLFEKQPNYANMNALSWQYEWKYINLWSQSAAVNYQGFLYSVPKLISWYHHKEDGYSHRNHFDNLCHKDMLEIINSLNLMRIIANYHLSIFHLRANIDSKRFSNVNFWQCCRFEGANESSNDSQWKCRIVTSFENLPHASWIRVAVRNALISFFCTICFTLNIHVKVSRLSL